MDFNKRHIELLVRALDHYKWYQVISDEEKEECVRIKRILQKLYKQIDGKQN